MQLNKFISQSGLCSRRNAEILIKSGKIKVNSNTITDSYYKVKENDTVTYKDEILKLKEKIYILLNKPKGFISTVRNEKGRKIIMDIIKPFIKERLFPIGRLDKDTTGLIILTNDGNLAQKLTHPSYEIKKKYIVTLNKKLIEKDYKRITKGLMLEDGFIKPDNLEYQDKKNILKIILHSGKKRIIKRIFDHVGYKVKTLDRIKYAGLHKKNLKKGQWRFLAKKEMKNIWKLIKKRD